jgi:hypothetical protein
MCEWNTLTGEGERLHFGHDILVQSPSALGTHGCLQARRGPRAAPRRVDLAQVRGGSCETGGGIAGWKEGGC